MTLLVMRHAPTSQNKETQGPERIRGWGNVGLGPEGQSIAKAAADALRSKPPAVIFTSDLPRAQETAEIVAKELGNVQVIPARELRTWNVGDITGQPVSKAKPQIDKLQHTNRTTPAPSGESYQQFYQRWSQSVQQLLHAARGQDALVVVHGRQVYSLPNILKGTGSRDIPTHGAPNPGDVLRVDDKSQRLTYVHQAGSPAVHTA